MAIKNNTAWEHACTGHYIAYTGHYSACTADKLRKNEIRENVIGENSIWGKVVKPISVLSPSLRQNLSRDIKLNIFFSYFSSFLQSGLFEWGRAGREREREQERGRVVHVWSSQGTLE